MQRAVELLCHFGSAPACTWHHHNYKHFPAKGTTKAHTRHPNPAKYLRAFDQNAIRELEWGTARTPDATDGERAGRTRYLRVLELIGWDEGKDADVSFVECSGAPGSRAFHGRPMHRGNAIAQEILPEER